jgi:hypothetical protein
LAWALKEAEQAYTAAQEAAAAASQIPVSKCKGQGKGKRGKKGDKGAGKHTGKGEPALANNGKPAPADKGKKKHDHTPTGRTDAHTADKGKAYVPLAKAKAKATARQS